MSCRFSRAIVRAPSSNFADGLTSVALGRPEFTLALEQHARYCEALERCGLELVRLPEDPAHPDATFVEDTAVLSERCNVLARPGVPSRAGEVTAIRAVLSSLALELNTIESPGSLEGGDICEAREHFFIGVSQRTNREGAAQLAAHLTRAGLESSCIDIRAVADVLHLKSGVASLGDGRIAVIDSLRDHPALKEFELVHVPPGEEYTVNCVRVNDRVLMASGSPRMQHSLERLGYDLIVLDMSEFRKMDGGLSCLSLRF